VGRHDRDDADDPAVAGAFIQTGERNVGRGDLHLAVVALLDE
jgi:hypothetical protein